MKLHQELTNKDYEDALEFIHGQPLKHLALPLVLRVLAMKRISALEPIIALRLHVHLEDDQLFVSDSSSMEYILVSHLVDEANELLK